jgi:hypothetical protein
MSLRTARFAAGLRILQCARRPSRFFRKTLAARCGTRVAQQAAMLVLRQATKRAPRRTGVPIVVLAVALFAAGCSGASEDESGTVPNVTLPDGAACESTSLDDRCSPVRDDETADDQELNRDELERELDRIEQEISASEP